MIRMFVVAALLAISLTGCYEAEQGLRDYYGNKAADGAPPTPPRKSYTSW